MFPTHSDPETPAPNDSQTPLTPDSASETASVTRTVDDSKPVHAPHGTGEVFDETVSFEKLGLRNSVLKGIQACGFLHPTKTQAMLLPAIMTGKDILGQAKTGTGKTAAFALPLLHSLEKDKQFQALILAPTRELAMQITAEIDELGQFTPIRSVCLFGGQAVRQQAGQIERGGGQIIVGTPGRIMDMLERRLIHFNNVKVAVLDEVDRMLDIGFRDDIRKILEKIPQRHQTVFVSATISPDIERLARKFMHEPEKVIVASGSLTVSLVQQLYLAVAPWDKRRLLVHLLKHEEPALTLVFCRLKRVVDELCGLLIKHGIDAHAIHGDMPQGKRNSTMKRLRDGQLGVLICSDLASRGIDVDDITHVINYDLPEDPEVYVHRIGRTARAGRKGIAWSLVTPEQGELLTSIELLINAEIPKMDYPDFIAGERPPTWRDPDERKEGGLRLATTPEVKPQPVIVNRTDAAVNPEMPRVDSADPSKFPGGLVPTKLPPKRMWGKMPTGR